MPVTREYEQSGTVDSVELAVRPRLIEFDQPPRADKVMTVGSSGLRSTRG
jgi:hypothetical protein